MTGTTSSGGGGWPRDMLTTRVSPPADPAEPAGLDLLIAVHRYHQQADAQKPEQPPTPLRITFDDGYWTIGYRHVTGKRTRRWGTATAATLPEALARAWRVQRVHSEAARDE